MVSSTSVANTTNATGRVKVLRKVAPGRGRRREEWVERVYADLLEEFERLRSAGAKLSYNNLLIIAKELFAEILLWRVLYYKGRELGD